MRLLENIETEMYTEIYNSEIDTIPEIPSIHILVYIVQFFSMDTLIFLLKWDYTVEFCNMVVT